VNESITVERVRHALVVGRLDADGAAVLLAANLPRKRDRTFVVVGASSVDAMTRLDPWVVADLADEVRGDLCVVAPGFGSMGRDGTLPPARLLADRLGVEVTAADGHPVGLADGSVFVPGQTAGWVSYRPGGSRIPVGARFPAPWWQEGLPDPADHITHVPVGLWVRRPGTPERPADPLLRRVPDLDRMYIVLGAPGELPPTGATVAEVLRTLPDEGRDRAVLAWYGSGALADAMASAVAEELGAPVRVAHGVPGDGGLVYIDEGGTARWRPFAVESVYRPDGPPVLDRWVAPPTLAMAEPGSFRLTAGWRVDVVARGLAVRPESVRLDPAVLAAGTGPTADVVFATDGPVPDAVLRAFDWLVRELPADTRDVLRILPADQQAEDALAGAEAADRVVPVATADQPAAAPPDPDEGIAPPAGAVMVTADGRMFPAAPILAAPVAHPEAASVDIQNGVLVIDLAADTAADASYAGLVVDAAFATADPPDAAFVVDAGLIVDAAYAAAGTDTAAVFTPDAAVVAADTAAADETDAAAVYAATSGTDTAADQTPNRIPDYAADAAGVGHDVAAGSGADDETDAADPPQPVANGIPSVAAATVAPSVASPPPGLAQGIPPVHHVTPMSQFATRLSPAASPVAQHTAQSTVDSTVDISADSGVGSIAGLLPGRDRRPAPQQALPVAQVSTPIEVPENARSTKTQRRAMRAKLGSRYDVATRAVTRLLSERPGLRFGSGDRAALLAELAVVRVFADDPDDPDGHYDTDFYVCLADGLRRLPTARTVVVRGIPADTEVQPESVIRLPTPMVAAQALSASTVGPAEALIWTTTGRRLDGLLDADEPGDESGDEEEEAAPSRSGDVVLSGHTRLRVLAVESAPVRRILLAEDGAAPEAALTRLRAAAAARPDPAQLPQVLSVSRWFGPLPAA
jgi:hypothetical protein